LFYFLILFCFSIGLPSHTKATFFGHFCAGEDECSIRPKVESLRACGVGSILDYAAEADVVVHDKNEGEEVDPNLLSARTFEYQGAMLC
jgi:proline dehydrogenase